MRLQARHQLCLGLVANDTVNRFAILEEQQSRNAHYPKSHGCIVIAVNIQLTTHHHE